MKAIKCEMCGSIDVVKDGEYYVCQSCGTKYTVEAARKLMVEGTVKIDTSDNVKKWLEVARRSRKGNDIVTAARYYDMVMAEDPNNWEAAFYTMYCSSVKIKNEEIQFMAQRLSDSMRGIGELVFAIENTEERAAAIADINESIISISATLSSYADNYYSKLPATNITKHINTNITCCKIPINWGDVLYEHIGEQELYKQNAIRMYKAGIEITPKLIKDHYLFNDKDISATIGAAYKDGLDYLRKTVKKVCELDPEYNQNVQEKKSGCYVATCVYGSYDCPQVWTLRRYRDDTLGATWYGRAFIRTYYAISPTLVKWFGKTKWFKKMWQGKLDRMVKNLNDKGVENTPYQDKQW